MNPEEFQQHLFGAINSAAKDGVHPALILFALDIARAQIIQNCLKMPPDGQEPPSPPERSRILKPPGT